MSNQFDSLAVPAGNGVGASTSFVNRFTSTVAVVGAFSGLVVIEGSADDVEYIPLATFENPSFQTLEQPYPIPFLRVRRSAIVAGETPGTPAVTVGSSVELTSVAMLPAPVSGTGAGVAVDISTFLLDGVAVAGDFTEHEVVHVEISHDGVCWAAAVPPSQNPRPYQPGMAARYARQRIVGQIAGGVTPTVGVFGRTVPICYEDLTMPALNGPGDAIDTSECGPDKTVIVGAPGGDVPCRIAVQGSNDGGATFVTVQSWNTTGVRKLTAVFQQMRVDIEGLSEATPGLCVGVCASTVSCDTPEEGASNEEHSNADDDNEFAEGVTLARPAGVQQGDLLVVAIAITYQPHLGTSPVPPGALAVIEPVIAGQWEVVLADYPDGVNVYSFGGGEFEEEDRIAVFRRVVQAVEPASYDFTWAAGGGATSFCSAIKAFTVNVLNASPFVVDAPASGLNATASGGNPVNNRTPGNTALEDGELLLGFFMARNGLNPAPGGTTFTTPAGMADLSTPINLQTSGLADPLGLGMFIQEVAAGAIPIKTSTCDITDAPPTPFRGAGYSILIAGCPLPQPPPPT